MIVADAVAMPVIIIVMVVVDNVVDHVITGDDMIDVIALFIMNIMLAIASKGCTTWP